MNKIVDAAEFKANCLKLIDEMQRDGVPITIIRDGKPVADMHPRDELTHLGPSKRIFGMMRGTVIFEGDIISPVTDPGDWDRDNSTELYRSSCAPAVCPTMCMEIHATGS